MHVHGNGMSGMHYYRCHNTPGEAYFVLLPRKSHARPSPSERSIGVEDENQALHDLQIIRCIARRGEDVQAMNVKSETSRLIDDYFQKSFLLHVHALSPGITRVGHLGGKSLLAPIASRVENWVAFCKLSHADFSCPVFPTIYPPDGVLT